MTTTTTLIARPGGVIRVLRLFAGASIYACSYDVLPDQDMCEVCGCTETYNCAGGCTWGNASHRICTRCLERMLT